MSGYSFAMPSEGKQAHEWVCFKASQLGKDLAWSKMQLRLEAALPEPKIVEPPKKVLETRSRHQERIEAARMQARAKDLDQRRFSARAVARDKASKESVRRTMQWRRKHTAAERTTYPSYRAEIAQVKKLHDAFFDDRPVLTAAQRRSAARAQQAREQRQREYDYYRPPETPRQGPAEGSVVLNLLLAVDGFPECQRWVCREFDRHVTPTGNGHDIVAELLGIRSGHDDILPAAQRGHRSDVNQTQCRPGDS